MLLLLSMGLYSPTDDNERIVTANSVFQNDPSQIGFQYQTRYFKIKPVKPVFVNEKDLFGITIVQFQIENCIINMLSDSFLLNTV